MAESFPLAPAGAKPLYVMIPLAVLGLLILVGAMWAVRASRASSVELSATHLRVRADVYGRRIPLDRVRAADARVVDLRGEPTLQPRIRTMGTAMPGYRAGWFRLRGGEKALLYLAGDAPVVYLPTTAGYSVMVSMHDPEPFLRRLRAVAVPAT